MVQWPVVSSNELLVNLPTDFPDHLNDIIGHLSVILLANCINTTKRLLSVHVDPGLLESLLLFKVSFPEFVLLLDHVVVEDLIREVLLSVLLVRKCFLNHTTLANLDT